MKTNKPTHVFALLVSLLGMLTATTACKHSGVAVTDRAQVMDIDISGAEDLPDNYTDEIRVSVQNRGANNLDNVEFTVELPPELLVVEESRGDGMNVMPMQTASGNRLYHYRVGDIEVGQESRATFRVTTRFGSLDRTGNIRVTAWQADLPNDKLVETKMIKLRR